jgi:hypothetical protein
LRSRRRTLGYGAIGVVAYVVALIASWPARFLIDSDPHWAVAGTIWRGEAVLDGAYRVEWRWAPVRSLANLGFAADWRMTGSGADLAGSAVAWPGSLLLEGVSGQGDAALLAALTHDLPFACDAALTVDLPRILLDGAKSSMEGEVRSDPGSCAAPGSEGNIAAPALLMRATRDRAGVTNATLAPLAQPRLTLAEGSLAGGRLSVSPTRAGTSMLPFLRNWRIDRSW